MVIQIFWVRAALEINESQFDQRVHTALRQVAERVAVKNKQQFLHRNPVIRVDENNYVVNINSEIDAEQLEHYLITTFDYYNIRQDIDYGIYDCASSTMLYCNYISKEVKNVAHPDLPKFENIDYYFTVRFPHKAIMSMNNIPMWVITSVILMVVLFFFFYALYVVFNQRSITKMQRDFINNMTHEFKTPIATISVIQQILAQDLNIDKERKSKYVDIVGTEILRLNDQVEKVLSITKIESNTLILNLEEISLHELLHRIIQNWMPRESGDSRKLISTLDANDDIISADLLHLTNVITNIIDNAVKYSALGKDVFIHSYNSHKALHLSIRDQGIGLNRKDAARIFDKFFRVSTDNIHNTKGFGLGLFYVKKIIEAHLWKIKVVSEPGKGSEFEIIIPVK